MGSGGQDGGARLFLTGAGFTHTIGAPLASGVWELIFNHKSVQAAKAIKALMVSNFKYEDVYHLVQTDAGYSEDDRDAMVEAVRSAFRDIDAIVKAFGTGGRSPQFDLRRFERTVEDLAGHAPRVFTLNHDVFIERWYGPRIWLPGVPNPRIAAEDDPPAFHMPTQEAVESAKADSSEDLHYIKLHGSQNWIGDHGLVIGLEKRGAIEAEPLLKWYHELFREALVRADAEVLCIGYGFRDKHINEMLEEGIGGGTRLHVVDPQDPEVFFGRLQDQRLAIPESIASYLQATLADLFPWHTQATDGSRPPQLRRLYRNVLGTDPGPS